MTQVTCSSFLLGLSHVVGECVPAFREAGYTSGGGGGCPRLVVVGCLLRWALPPAQESCPFSHVGSPAHHGYFLSTY